MHSDRTCSYIIIKGLTFKNRRLIETEMSVTMMEGNWDALNRDTKIAHSRQACSPLMVLRALVEPKTFTRAARFMGSSNRFMIFLQECAFQGSISCEEMLTIE